MTTTALPTATGLLFLATACVPLLPLDGAPCPCSADSTCCDGVCVTGTSCSGSAACGNNVLDDGEVCDPGLDAVCGDASAPLFSARCSADCGSIVTAACDVPLDLLIVVDNSGSMCEEQEALRRGLWDPLCPIVDLEDIPATYANPSPEVVESLAATCGLVQLLALLSPSIHVGVITTDASGCDNDFLISDLAGHPNLCDGEAQPDWGRRPQAGCLQGSVSQGTKVMRSSDDDLALRIADAVTTVGTLGSPFERGLDAIRLFLDEGTPRAVGCESDRDDFLRQGARLAVLIISDEDDCSHDPDGPFGDENANEYCDAATGEIQVMTPQTDCYDRPDVLTPVDETRTFLHDLKGNPDLVSVLFMGGVTKSDNSWEAAGCRVDNGATSTTCTPSRGTSNFTAPHLECNADALAAQGLPPCCEADGAPRYHAFVSSFADRGHMSSLCVDSVADSIRDVGVFLSTQNRPIVAE
jgi:hypothetical protein